MSVNVQPLADNVVAVNLAPQTKTASGLYLPGGAAEKPKMVKVVAVGPSVKQVKVGDQIICKNYGSTDVKVEKVDYLIIKEEDILATVN